MTSVIPSNSLCRRHSQIQAPKTGMFYAKPWEDRLPDTNTEMRTKQAEITRKRYMHNIITPARLKSRRCGSKGTKFVLAIVSHQARMIVGLKKVADVNPFELGKSLFTEAKVKEKKEQDRKELDGKRKLAENCVQRYSSMRSCLASSVQDGPGF